MTTNSNMADPGGFLALLPGLLGFAPQEAMVVATVCAHSPERVRHLLSLGLAQLDEEACSRIRPLLALALAHQEPPAVVVAIFEEGGVLAEQRKLCARFALTALPVEARLLAAFSAPSAVPGAPWRSVLGPRCRGVVAAHPRVGSREALKGRLRPNPHDLARVVRAARRLRGQEEVVPAAEREMLGLIRHPQSSAAIGPGQAARFAEALREREVRDRLISATVEAAQGSRAQDQEGAAERLWSCLVPMLPDDSRAEAACLLALDSYARGRGAAARIALEVALAANPAHELAQLLEACLFTGVRPEALGVLIQR